MRELLFLVRARDHAHRAVRHVARGERDPGAHDVRGAQAPIRCILVPAHERGVACFLDEEVRCPAVEVRPVEVLDRVEQSVVAHDLR